MRPVTYTDVLHLFCLLRFKQQCRKSRETCTCVQDIADTCFLGEDSRATLMYGKSSWLRSCLAGACCALPTLVTVLYHCSHTICQLLSAYLPIALNDTPAKVMLAIAHTVTARHGSCYCSSYCYLPQIFGHLCLLKAVMFGLADYFVEHFCEAHTCNKQERLDRLTAVAQVVLLCLLHSQQHMCIKLLQQHSMQCIDSFPHVSMVAMIHAWQCFTSQPAYCYAVKATCLMTSRQ